MQTPCEPWCLLQTLYSGVSHPLMCEKHVCRVKWWLWLWEGIGQGCSPFEWDIITDIFPSKMRMLCSHKTVVRLLWRRCKIGILCRKSNFYLNIFNTAVKTELQILSVAYTLKCKSMHIFNRCQALLKDSKFSAIIFIPFWSPVFAHLVTMYYKINCYFIRLLW